MTDNERAIKTAYRVVQSLRLPVETAMGIALAAIEICKSPGPTLNYETVVADLVDGQMRPLPERGQ